MIESIGHILGGVGLFFAGMWLLSENLKSLANRRIRTIAANWVPNRFAALGWGVLSGSVTQNMSALTFITISMLRANLLSTPRAFAFIIGGNLGTGLLVLLVTLDIQVAAFYALIVASALMVSEKTVRLRNLGAALFGLALMFIGLGLIKDSAALLSGQMAFDQFMEVTGNSLWISFLGAAVLTFIVQSSPAVVMFGISLGAAGVLTNDQVMMLFFGSIAGSTAILLALSWNLNGASRQLAMFQILYNLVLVAVFVLLLYVELWYEIPLMKALVLAIPLPQPMAALGPLCDVFLVAPFILLLPQIVPLFSRLCPATATESISRLAYIHHRGYGDITTSLELVGLEQRRVFSSFSLYLEAARSGTGVESLRNAVRPVIREIEEFLTEVRTRHPGHSIGAANSMLTQQRLIAWLEEQFAELCATLDQLPDEAPVNQLRAGLLEGIDTVVLVINDAMASQDAESWSMALELTGDRNELLARLRSAYLEGAGSFDRAVQSNILKATNTAGEIFYLLSRLTREMEPSIAEGQLTPPSR